MWANEDIGWKGGDGSFHKAKKGDDVDGRTIPDGVRQKWLDCNVLVESEAEVGTPLTGPIGEREAVLAAQRAEKAKAGQAARRERLNAEKQKIAAIQAALEAQEAELNAEDA